MRGFLILCAFVTVTTAAPQQGYQYGAQPVGGQLPHALPQSEVQYSAMTSQTTDFLKDLQTVMAVQSGNLAPNFASSTQHQVVANAGGAASARMSVGQPQARYLAPEPVPGVNSFHQQQVPHQQIPQQQVPLQPVPQQLVPQQQILQQHVPQQHVQQQNFLQHQVLQQVPQQRVPLQQPQQAQHLQQQKQQAPESETVISKRFYLHAAPEDDEGEVKQHHVTVGKPRKNYNVVFIKSSDKSSPKTSLKITPAVNEEKTVIYVLNKKHDATDIDTQVYEPVTSTAKPEVYFIKYKTAEEAAHAQQTIQAQYDALGGSTQVSNEGVAAESSVIGALEAAATTAKHTEAEAAAESAADDAAGASEATHSPPAAQTNEQQQAVQIPVVPAAGQSAVNAQPEEQLQSVEQSLVQSGVNTNNGYLPPARYYYR
ncbi:homeotic protein female sterile-like [Ceratitis capitata]|uniref:homeotic protein female sterile-like n=1 Tax=Ceratitis capitata TaxID=7213 RepID=UPI000618974D|nr:homeotic protein female sterile-like [Ceratitis capitata]